MRLERGQDNIRSLGCAGHPTAPKMSPSGSHSVIAASLDYIPWWT